MRVRLLALSLVLMSVAAACSSGDDAAGPPAETAPTTAEPAPTTSVPAPTTTVEPDPATASAVVTEGGIVVPVISHAGSGWTVRTPCHATATLPQERGRHAGSPVIVLDPGHGGAEPGAVSPSGLAEAPVNLAVSRHTKAALEAEGVSTLMTRTGDYEVHLATRSEIARNTDPEAFVSIHHNAEPDGPWPGPGAETYYQMASPDSKRLAGLIYEEVVRAFAQYDVAWVADRDAGAKYRPSRTPGNDYYAMLRQPGSVVSVLVEGAFMSNPPEAALLARPEVQKVEGEAIARGILRYLNTDDPGSGFVEPYPRIDPPSRPGTPGPSRRCRDPQL